MTRPTYPTKPTEPAMPLPDVELGSPEPVFRVKVDMHGTRLSMVQLLHVLPANTDLRNVSIVPLIRYDDHDRARNDGFEVEIWGSARVDSGTYWPRLRRYEADRLEYEERMGTYEKQLQEHRVRVRDHEVAQLNEQIERLQSRVAALKGEAKRET